MRFICLWFFLAGVFTTVQAQTEPEISTNFEDLLKAYQSALEQFTDVQGCGNAFDGPAFYIKKLENSSLDALLTVSDEEEMRMGDEVFERIKTSWNLIEDHPKLAKATEILNKLTAHVDRKAISYKIHVVESEEINAFAIVGGHIFITTDIINFVDNWDELAFIIAHEVAHIDRYHTLRKQKKLLLAKGFTQFVDQEELTKLALDINLTLSAPFDQMDEYEADRVGAELAKNAGFNTDNFSAFFTKLSQHQNKSFLHRLIRNHPYADDRIDCLKEYLEKN